eukprot:14443110-Alexandrium_andersonii.AAC.1
MCIRDRVCTPAALRAAASFKVSAGRLTRGISPRKPLPHDCGPGCRMGTLIGDQAGRLCDPGLAGSGVGRDVPNGGAEGRPG